MKSLYSIVIKKRKKKASVHHSKYDLTVSDVLICYFIHWIDSGENSVLNIWNFFIKKSICLDLLNDSEIYSWVSCDIIIFKIKYYPSF